MNVNLRTQIIGTTDPELHDKLNKKVAKDTIAFVVPACKNKDHCMAAMQTPYHHITLTCVKVPKGNDHIIEAIWKRINQLIKEHGEITPSGNRTLPHGQISDQGNRLDISGEFNHFKKILNDTLKVEFKNVKFSTFDVAAHVSKFPKPKGKLHHDPDLHTKFFLDRVRVYGRENKWCNQ